MQLRMNMKLKIRSGNPVRLNGKQINQ